MNKIKAIIYDVDGTMVNSEPVHVDAWSRALSLHGVALSDLSEIFQRTMAGKKPAVIAHGMVEELTLPINPEDLLEEKSRLFLEAAEQNLEAMSGVVESVKRFKAAGYKLGIGTSLDRSFLGLVLAKLGVEKYFDAIVTGDQIKKGKPDPETYLTVAEALGLPPHECVVLEDAESGILSAKAAGAYCIAIENGDAIKQNTDKADIVVSSLNDISTDIIKKIAA